MKPVLIFISRRELTQAIFAFQLNLNIFKSFQVIDNIIKFEKFNILNFEMEASVGFEQAIFPCWTFLLKFVKYIFSFFLFLFCILVICYLRI